MDAFDFTLIFKVDSDENIDELVERLGAADCTDALVGTGRAGYIALQFLRKAPTLQQARETAIADVMRAIPGVRLENQQG